MSVEQSPSLDIESRLLKMGARAHHVNADKIDTSGREGIQRFGKAIIHNLSHIEYDATVLTRESTSDGRVLRRKHRRVEEAWEDVVATNRALPPKLRGRHTR